MANYMLVNADKLDSDLEMIAGSIRAKSGKSDKLSFPDGFKEMIDGIVLDSGAKIQTKEGIFSTSRGSATVNCGFKPDLVVITNNITYQGFASAGFAFTASGKTNLETAIWGSASAFIILSIQCRQSSTGFSVNVTEYEDDPVSYNGRLSYIAVKYTK